MLGFWVCACGCVWGTYVGVVDCCFATLVGVRGYVLIVAWWL